MQLLHLLNIGDIGQRLTIIARYAPCRDREHLPVPQNPRGIVEAIYRKRQHVPYFRWMANSWPYDIKDKSQGKTLFRPTHLWIKRKEHIRNGGCHRGTRPHVQYLRHGSNKAVAH